MNLRPINSNIISLFTKTAVYEAESKSLLLHKFFTFLENKVDYERIINKLVEVEDSLMDSEDIYFNKDEFIELAIASVVGNQDVLGVPDIDTADTIYLQPIVKVRKFDSQALSLVLFVKLSCEEHVLHMSETIHCNFSNDTLRDYVDYNRDPHPNPTHDDMESIANFIGSRAAIMFNMAKESEDAASTMFDRLTKDDWKVTYFAPRAIELHDSPNINAYLSIWLSSVHNREQDERFTEIEMTQVDYISRLGVIPVTHPEAKKLFENHQALYSVLAGDLVENSGDRYWAEIVSSVFTAVVGDMEEEIDTRFYIKVDKDVDHCTLYLYLNEFPVTAINVD